MIVNLAINSPGLSATPCQGPPNQLGGTSRTFNRALPCPTQNPFNDNVQRDTNAFEGRSRDPTHVPRLSPSHGMVAIYAPLPFEHCRPSFKKNSQYCNVPTSCKELPLSGPYIGLLNRDALFHRI